MFFLLIAEMTLFSPKLLNMDSPVFGDEQQEAVEQVQMDETE
jgi:hypothetical protein